MVVSRVPGVAFGVGAERLPGFTKIVAQGADVLAPGLSGRAGCYWCCYMVLRRHGRHRSARGPAQKHSLVAAPPPSVISKRALTGSRAPEVARLGALRNTLRPACQGPLQGASTKRREYTHKQGHGRLLLHYNGARRWPRPHSLLGLSAGGSPAVV